MFERSSNAILMPFVLLFVLLFSSQKMFENHQQAPAAAVAADIRAVSSEVEAVATASQGIRRTRRCGQWTVRPFPFNYYRLVV